MIQLSKYDSRIESLICYKKVSKYNTSSEQSASGRNLGSMKNYSENYLIRIRYSHRSKVE